MTEKQGNGAISRVLNSEIASATQGRRNDGLELFVLKKSVIEENMKSKLQQDRKKRS